jgi:cell division protease FtsH
VKNKSIIPANWVRIAIVIVALIAVVMAIQPLREQFGNTGEPATLAEVAQQINAEQVESITVEGDNVSAKLKDGTVLDARKESNVSIYETLTFLGVEPGNLQNGNISVVGPTAMSTLGTVVLSIVPLLVIGWFALHIMRSMRSGQDQAMTFGRSRAKMINVDTPVVTFDDVAGAEESKQELREVVEFLRDPEKFQRLGARVPKGVLMIGPPGTGKTLLARAVAGEAGVPFMSISGSEFVEMFVGVGASRVRDLFHRAKQLAPCIVFVDEIDAVGRARGTGLGGGHDEREQTLNQILVEMDGFDNDTNIIVIAATNRADVLDPALLRPGRFDRKVHISRPDVKGRESILNVHVKGKPVGPDVDLHTLAKLTPGFAGADLENLVNEAAIIAAQRDMPYIGMKEMQDAMEKIIAGPELRSRVVTPKERNVVAWHEAGHAVVMFHLTHADPVHKITIIPHGAAGGYTMSLPESMDSGLMLREQLQEMIVGLLGGRAAEELHFHHITTGASNDLERCTAIAHAMVTKYGMSEKLGLRVYGEEQHELFFGRSMGGSRDYSEEAARAIDEEVAEIITDSYAQAKDILREQQDKLDALANALLEFESIDRDQFEQLMQGQFVAEPQ